jgi:hypothetical protein
LDYSNLRRIARGSLVCAIALVISACGGGGGGGGAGGKQPAASQPPPTPNAAPVASAGEDLTVFRNTTVTLDGSASSDPDNNALTFRWVQQSGAPVTLTNASTAKPSFNVPAISGVLVFRLVVNDGRVDSAVDEVSITIQNRVPVAGGGNDISAYMGSIVKLPGSASVDPDGDPLTYTWLQTVGPKVETELSSNGDLTFAAPGWPTVIEFSVTVSDGELVSNTDTVQISIGGGTLAPFVDAGFDQFVPRNATVQLFGWAYDYLGEDVAFTWTQISGPAVTLSDVNSPTPSFKSPNQPGVIVLELTASNKYAASLPDRLEIDVRNYAPALTVTLTPDSPRTLDDIAAVVDVYDADADQVEVKYTWKRNGVLVPDLTAKTFPNARQQKGDVIEFAVEAKDGIEISTSVASVTIQDTPAVITANPPTQLNYGGSLSFSVSASDVDGDAIGDFALKYGPAGMTVSAAGVVSWTAVLPMFANSQLVNYGIGLANQSEAVLKGAVTVKDANRTSILRRTGIEIPARDGALKVADLDADGKSEALIASSDMVYELSWNGSAYVQTWSYPFYLDRANGITVEAANVTGDSKMEIFIAAGARLLRLDGASRRVAAELDLGASGVCKKIEFGDLDGDGTKELACLVGNGGYYGSSYVAVIDPIAMTEKWRTPEFGDYSSYANGLSLGNVDNDPALEIIVGSGYVFDGATHQAQWAYGPGFGFAVDSGDVDGDGVDEIVGMQDWTSVRVFSATVKSPLWDVAVSDVDALLVRDVDGSPAAEIIVGDGQWGNVTAYKFSAGNLNQLFQINSRGHGVTTIDFGDLDGDGMKEFIWGTDATSSGPDSIVVAGRNPSIAVEWINDAPKQLNGVFAGGKPATIGPAQSRLIFGVARTDNGYAGARLLTLDPNSGELKVSANEIGSNWSGVLSLDPVDYDSDGVDEVFLSSATLYTGFLSAYDFAGNTEEWTSPTDVGTTQAITHADLNGDGSPDLIAISQGTSGGPRIQVFDVKNSNLIWRSVALTGAPVDVWATNLTGDSTPEIIALTGDRVTIYTKSTLPATFIESMSYPVSGGTDLLVADTDGDSKVEIYVLSGGWYNSAEISRFTSGLTHISTYAVGQPARSLHVEDLPTSHRNIIVSTGDDYYATTMPPELRALDPLSGAVVWRSPQLPELVNRNSLFYVDTDADGKPQISFAAGSSAWLTH